MRQATFMRCTHCHILVEFKTPESIKWEVLNRRIGAQWTWWSGHEKHHNTKAIDEKIVMVRIISDEGIKIV